MDPIIVQKKSNNKIITTLIVVAILLLVGAGFYFLYGKIFQVDPMIITEEAIENTTANESEPPLSDVEIENLAKLMSGDPNEISQNETAN